MHFDKRTSANLDYLKAFAAFLVVLGHCLSYYTAWQPLPLFAGIAEDLIYHVHVPLFFTIFRLPAFWPPHPRRCPCCHNSETHVPQSVRPPVGSSPPFP